jgi:diguanylate cyclase (GGDEF)-like protein
MDSKDSSPSDRHGADLALMRLGHEMRRRIRDRVAFTDALRDTAARMGACAALLWMPYSRLAVHAGGTDDAVSVPVAAEFEGILARIAVMEPGGQPTIIQGDDPRAERRAACRLLIVPMETGTARFPAWLVFARELASPRFDTWSAVLSQVQSLRLSRRLTHEFDPATGHLSRRGLRTVIAQRKSGCGAVILADLDGLRTLNHTRGLAAGDDVITAFGRLLESPLLPERTLVARLDGGKFAMFVADVDAAAAARLAVELQSMLASVAIKDHDDFPRLTVSCGIAEYSFSGESIDKVLLAADIMLRLAKERGRSRIEIHASNDASAIRVHDDDFAATELRDALREGRLTLFAQPIVSLRDRKHPLGFELLLRLRDDGDGPGDPGRLLAVAQRYQLLPMVDRYVVDQAFAILAPHREVLARQRITMAVNVSGQSLSDPEFATHFIEQLRLSKLPTGCIVVEVTEQVATGNLAKAAEVMRRLRAAGCGIAIDDFGTGANSLAYVHQLPVTRLKIDGSFVRDITTNKKSEAAVRGIVQLARDFVLQTVGEFVEDQQQSELLRRLGVDFGQGYLFGKPEPLDATVATLVERESADRQEVVNLG